MKELNDFQMQEIQGGLSKECIAALIGMGIAISGGLLSFATLNPAGIVFSVLGIYAGAPAIALACNQQE